MKGNVHGRAGELEAELASTRRLAALGTLTVPLATELTALLGAIASHTERALGNPGSLANDRELTLILAATSRARTIVEQLHRLARRRKKEPVALDLGAIVSDGVALLRFTLPGTIGLEVRITPELDLVMVDQMAAHQVLVSLVGGTVSTLRPGEALLVSVDRCMLDGALAAPGKGVRSGAYVKLAVCTRAAPDGPASVTRGWGFELAVVEGIVKEHGGVVLAETAHDGSRTVACLFPALEQAPLVTARASSAARP
jgi:light-regulated signal transduction histidine kinase (bacteriophytochrome)